MAFAVSAKRTVLWDQIQYVGAPSEFGWVLPIRGKVDVGVSSDELFNRLESSTAPEITPPPPPTCPPPEKRCRTSCTGDSFSATDAGTAGGAQDTSTVDVWGTSVVGPYEATQLSATDGTALRNWLTEHGYTLPAAIGPVIDKYIAEGFGFLVIKLVPSADQNRMVPIRIGFDGSSPTLPLRMIAAGTGEKVGIKLFVLGDGRWEAKNFANGEVRTADLVWDWQAMGSNFGSLELALLNGFKGGGFITETSLDVTKTTLTAGLPPGTVSSEAGTTFSTITDTSELDAAFPAKSSVRVTRMFAELSASALGVDLDLQASVGGAIPRSRQAPKSVNYSCQTFVEVECPGTSPVCDGQPVNPGVQPGEGVQSSGEGDFGCSSSSSSSPGAFGWAMASVLGLAFVTGVRRRVSGGKKEIR
jgi:MYXO-CTERM domain-containing protein